MSFFVLVHTKQQTYHENTQHVSHVSTHICEIHRVTDFVTYTVDKSNENRRELNEENNETIQDGQSKHVKGRNRKTVSNESDVDSGLGSSSHEINAGELTDGGSNVAQCNVLNNEKAVDESNTQVSNSTLFSIHQEQHDATDGSFEDLIKLAKDGMSISARERVDGLLKIAGRIEIAEKVEKQEFPLSNMEITRWPSNSSRSEEAETRKNSFCNGTFKEEKELDSISQSFELPDCTTKTTRKAQMANEAHEDQVKKLEKNIDVSCNITNTTINVRPVSEDKNDFIDPRQQFSHEQHNEEKKKRGIEQFDENAVKRQQHIHVPLRIQDSKHKTVKNTRLVNSQIRDPNERPISLILPSSNEKAGNNTLNGLGKPGREHLSSTIGISSGDNGVIRFFSATIRRKLTREESAREDNSKKQAGFRSFRFNKKKKNHKSANIEELNQSSGMRSDNINYTSTIDKIMWERKVSACTVFKDVPFTIPDITE